MTLAELIARRAALKAEGDGIIAAARTANIDLTEAQDQRMLAISGEMDKLWADMPAAEASSNATAATAARTEGAAEGVKTATATALEIVALCAIAKVPSATAHGFLKDGKSVDDVRVALAKAAETPQPTDINPRRGVADPSKASSWDASVARANKLNGVKTAA